jgi:arsenate reductase (glutaredoxin)
MILYHNPRCSKSREALAILNKHNQVIEIREYLKQPPSEKELKALLKKLKCKAIDIVRKKEELYLTEYKNITLSESEWIKVLCDNPNLIERPIVISKDTAVIGRPPERVIDLLK